MTCLPVPREVWLNGEEVTYKEGTRRLMQILDKTPVYAPATGVVEYIWQAHPEDSHVEVRIVAAEKTKSGDEAVYQLGPFRGDVGVWQDVKEGEVIGYVMRWMKHGWSKERFAFSVKVRRKRASDGKQPEKQLPIYEWMEKSRPRMITAPEANPDLRRFKEQLEREFPVEVKLMRQLEDKLKALPEKLLKKGSPQKVPPVTKATLEEVLRKVKKMTGETKKQADFMDDLFGVMKGTLAGLGIGAAASAGIVKAMAYFQGLSAEATALAEAAAALETEAALAARATLVAAEGLAADTAVLSAQAGAAVEGAGSFIALEIIPLIVILPEEEPEPTTL